MNLRLWFRWTTAVALVAIASVPTRAADADKSAKAIAPFLDDGTIAVGRLDLTKVDVPAIFKTLARFVPASPRDLQQSEGAVSSLWKRLRDNKVTEAFVVLSLKDIPLSQPYVIIPVGEGGDPRQVVDVLKAGGPPFRDTETIGNVVFAGSKATRERLRSLKPSPRPNLATAWRAVDGAAVQVAFVPSKEQLRVIAELMPKLPREFGGMTGKELSESVQWAAVGIHLPPKMKATLVASAADAKSAERLKQTVLALARYARKQYEKQMNSNRTDPVVLSLLKDLHKITELLAPSVKENRLTLSFDAENEAGKRVIGLFGAGVLQARKSAHRASSMNSLKQLGLAMHNFHDVYKSFPPHASYSKKGKPMLSWRVYVLPFLEGEALYKQFHLDEPWDSEHNKKLIARMPKYFADPSGQVKKPGMTRFVAPILAKGVFTGKPEGTLIRDITDGTSNTIMLVEAAPEKAVIWTKPDDLTVDLKDPLKGLFAKDAKGFNALIADGSVRFFSKAVKPQTLRLYFMRDDGQPINESP